MDVISVNCKTQGKINDCHYRFKKKEIKQRIFGLYTKNNPFKNTCFPKTVNWNISKIQFYGCFFVFTLLLKVITTE